MSPGPAPLVTLSLSFDPSPSPAPVTAQELASYVLQPCEAEAAAAVGADRFEVVAERAPAPVPSLGDYWTGAIQLGLSSAGGLRAACRGLWVGLRNLLRRPRTSFKVVVKHGKDSVELTYEQVDAVAGERGREVEALEQLLAASLTGLQTLPPGRTA